MRILFHTGGEYTDGGGGSPDGCNCCDCGCAFQTGIRAKHLVRVKLKDANGVDRIYSEWREGVFCGDCITTRGARDHEGGAVVKADSVELGENGKIAYGRMKEKAVAKK
jgi:hypothetical protein